jgi:hypothetical protein
MKWLATWIMNRIVGNGSSDWALAMRREYDELLSGHFGWSMGCLVATTVRELRTNWLFLFCIVFSAYFILVQYSHLIFQLAIYDRAFVTAHFYKLFIFAPVPFALALGYWRPDRILTISFLGGFICQGIGSTFYAMYQLGGSFYSWWIEAMWMDTLPVYMGHLVQFGIWYVAASAGGKLKGWQGSRLAQRAHSASNP